MTVAVFPSRLFVFGSVGRFRVRISADSEFIFLVMFVSSGKMATAVMCLNTQIEFKHLIYSLCLMSTYTP